MSFYRLFLFAVVGLLLAGFCWADEPEPFVNSIGMEMRPIPAGTFIMGTGNDFNDTLAHEVTISQPFFMAATEVTQSQFKKLMGHNPSWLSYRRGNYPVDSVTWFQAEQFCQKLTEQEGRTYRLPTEAEWEYACRAGTTTTYSFGDDPEQLGDYAWIPANTRTPMPVAQKLPNAYGLYDMHGNLNEWVSDWHKIRYYEESEAVDPTGPPESENLLGTGGKVTRGGDFLGNTGMNCLKGDRRSSATRNCWTPYVRSRVVGFRVVCEY